MYCTTITTATTTRQPTLCMAQPLQFLHPPNNQHNVLHNHYNHYITGIIYGTIITTSTQSALQVCMEQPLQPPQLPDNQHNVWHNRYNCHNHHTTSIMYGTIIKTTITTRQNSIMCGTTITTATQPV